MRTLSRYQYTISPDAGFEIVIIRYNDMGDMRTCYIHALYAISCDSLMMPTISPDAGFEIVIIRYNDMGNG